MASLRLSRAATTGVLALIAALGTARSEGSKKNSTIALPHSHDRYSAFVEELERGKTNIDYGDFRDSFLESEQFKTASGRRSDLENLRKRIYELMGESKNSEVAEKARQILSIDYTDMFAHKALRQAYKLLGKNEDSERHHDIEFGLLNSIVKHGDGKTCETGWPVIQVSEEYFVLDMIGARVLKQAIDNRGGVCDRMEVTTEEGKKVYYFDVRKVFEGYGKLGIR